MKTIIFFFFSFLMFITGIYAQQAYLFVYVPYQESGKIMDDSISFLSEEGILTQNLLITNGTYSCFYYFYDNSIKYKQDSAKPIDLTPVIVKEYDSAGQHYGQMKLTHPALVKQVDTSCVVYKNLREQKLYFEYSSRIAYGAIKKFFSDTLFPMKWTLIPEEKKFGNLLCKKATTFFRNREITVWYCPDIPISDGPWKLGGLPGPIVCWEQPADKALLLQSMHVVPDFPENLVSQWHELNSTHIPYYPSYRRMLDETAKKTKLLWQQEKSNCVSCQNTNSAKLTQTLTFYNPYEGIKYVFDL
ncbi:GLPGLI family protein [Thermoflavifilum thermophilum]|uniref:GLPGLI family protein n=1 Tax=Thermoflavifilum thermophilum TaxID=1393122 RepID=A0A1I7N9H0_9BACT|nr:GLPGLI family protein [Thermoflavifilum thermophilum]SFV31299.1 GLPGLI family protein [Thermoflavifilum thermophilum]